jgi:hypothetical protein
MLYVNVMLYVNNIKLYNNIKKIEYFENTYFTLLQATDDKDLLC